jgi:hypothetical protein
MNLNVGTLKKEQVKRRETSELRFLAAVPGYRMTDYRRNENFREELEVTYQYKNNSY